MVIRILSSARRGRLYAFQARGEPMLRIARNLVRCQAANDDALGTCSDGQDSARNPGWAPVAPYSPCLADGHDPAGNLVRLLRPGFLDLGALLIKKYCWNSEGYFRNARDFPWTVPVGHAALMVVPALVVTAVNRVRPALLSPRTVTWFFATLAIYSALLRMPLYGVCSLLLGAGLGRLIGDAVAPIVSHPRRLISIFGALVVVVCVLAVLTSGWQSVREYRSEVGLPPAPRALATSY